MYVYPAYFVHTELAGEEVCTIGIMYYAAHERISGRLVAYLMTRVLE
jgi:hypothetical protein